MLTAGPLALGQPVTHRDLLAVMRQAIAAGDTCPRICLQARYYTREGPFWLCAELLALGCSDAEWFEVQSAISKRWVHGRDLRLCSPDGRCYCADARPVEAPAARWPASNATTGETQQLSSLHRRFEVEPTCQPT